MEPLRWKSPNRKRQVGIKYTDPAYVIGYDLDNEDFTEIIIKLKNNEVLTAQEDKRYGSHPQRSNGGKLYTYRQDA